MYLLSLLSISKFTIWKHVHRSTVLPLVIMQDCTADHIILSPPFLLHINNFLHICLENHFMFLFIVCTFYDKPSLCMAHICFKEVCKRTIGSQNRLIFCFYILLLYVTFSSFFILGKTMQKYKESI